MREIFDIILMMLRTRLNINKRNNMEKTINIDSLNIVDIIKRIQYNEEEILDIIEGLSEAASALCYYEEKSQSVKAIADAQRILCEFMRIVV